MSIKIITADESGAESLADINANFAAIDSTFVDNEVVAGSGTNFVLAHTPKAGSQKIYGSGQRLTPGINNDYTIAGGVISIINGVNYPLGSILADYRI